MTLTLSPPHEKQKEFLLARSRYVAYGGARGGGKSHAVRLKATLLCLRYSGIRVLIVRRSYPELYENHIKIMTRELSDVALYRDTDKSLTFRNSSRIKFGYCSSDSDLLQYQGVEYDVIFMDEATHFTEYQFAVIGACMRGANNFPKRFYLTCNPGGIGHAWVKRLFVDREYREGESGENYTFIKSTVYDNKPLIDSDTEYVNTLKNLPSELRRAWLDGDWDVFAGQYFSEFSRDIHVYEDHQLPQWWKRYRAFDYGLDMFACLWAAVDSAGDLWIYREYTEPDLIVSEAAAVMHSLSGDEKIQVTVAPPDMYNRQKDTGKSMAECFEDAGIKLSRADNSRVQGWMILKEYLKPRQAKDGKMTARLHISSECRELIRCLPQLMHDEDSAMDVSTHPHEITHICDALRYMCMYRSSKSAQKPVQTYEQKYRQRAIRACRGTAGGGYFT